MVRKTEQYQDMIARLFPNPNLKEGEMGTKTVTFQVTDDCNLACTYCYQHNKGKHTLPFEVAQAFIEMLLEKDNENTKQHFDTWNSTAVVIEFIGGEPLLEIDLIDKISDYFVKRMIETDHPWAKLHRFSICSNGLLYFDPKVQRYIQKHLTELSFSISIDGNKELHDSCRIQPNGMGSYDIAMAGVRHYIDVLHGEMGSKMTLAPNNICYLYDAAVSLIENGYKEINLNCVYEEGWTVEHAKIMYDQLKKLADYIIDNDLFEEVYLSIFEENFFRPKPLDDTKCWCGGSSNSMIAIDWKGDIFTCIRFMESSLGDNADPIRIGSVYDGFLPTEKDKQIYNCLRCTDRINSSPEECLCCPIAEGCSDCTAYNYELYGLPIKRATFICVMHKARALANSYFWNKGYICTEQNKRMKIWLPDDDALAIIDQDELDYLHALEQ